MPKPECIICYKKINKKIEMNLTCECKYDIHKSCFMKWFKLNGYAWGSQVLMNVELDLRRLAVEGRK